MKNRPLTLAAVCGALIFSCATAWSQSDPYAAVNRLLNAKQNTAALAAAEAHLKTNPRDPQMRLLVGVAHTQNGQIDLARDVYVRLTQEFPELPEPHNNLATLHAKESNFASARESLEMAVRLNPNYAVAHENLGDVYVQLARQSYARAASLDRSAATIGPKRIQLEAVLRAPPPATPTAPTP